MSSSISRFFRKAFTSATPAPLGGRAISRPKPVASGLSQVTATDFSKARDMVNPRPGSTAGWAAISNDLRATLYRDVIPHPVARQGGIALPGHMVLVNARHAGKTLSAQDHRELVERHNLVPVGKQVPVKHLDGSRHTFTWAMPTNAYLDGLRALEAKAAPPPYSRRPVPALPGPVLGIGGLEGPAKRGYPLLGLPPTASYLGRYGS